MIEKSLTEYTVMNNNKSLCAERNHYTHCYSYEQQPKLDHAKPYPV